MFLLPSFHFTLFSFLSPFVSFPFQNPTFLVSFWLFIWISLSIHCCIMNFFSVALRSNAGHGLLILEVSRSHTTTHHSRYDSSGRVISSSQRPLPDNTQHSQQTNIHATGGIRTHDLSRRAATDLSLRTRSHWDRQYEHLYATNSKYSWKP
jgi:hypothetical protein